MQWAGAAAAAHFTLQAAASSLWSAPIQQAFRGRNSKKKLDIMRAETQNIVDEIKQAISLLRRHL
ncbi:MAG: hypothetical protein ABS58_04860 [Mesorhizobium sp. SCN 65-20]|nr:MAG: hypothetical protein ABS58_04860 [Mesorhizobium sp. SCN 65-20]